MFYRSSSAPIYRDPNRDFVGTSHKINTPERRQEVGLGDGQTELWCSLFLVIFFFFLAAPQAYRILVPQPGIELRPLPVKALSPNPWTTREGPASQSRYRPRCHQAGNSGPGWTFRAHAEVGRVWVLATRHQVQLPSERGPDLGKALLSSCWQLPDKDAVLNFQTANTPGNQGQTASILKRDSGVWAAAVVPTVCPVPTSSKYGDQGHEGAVSSLPSLWPYRMAQGTLLSL